MKRTISVVILMILCISLTAAPIATAAAAQNLILDGVPTILLPAPYEQAAEIMVPMRVMTEAMGVALSWDEDNKVIGGRRRESSFTVQLSSQQGSVNGQPVNLPCPVQMINQQCYIPLGFLCDALSASWNRQGETIWIYDKIEPKQTAYFSFAAPPDLHFWHLPEAGQGEYLSIYLENIAADDIVTLQTNLDNDAEFFRFGSGRILLLPVSCTQTPGFYSLRIRVQREKYTYLWAQEMIRVLPRTFPTQHLTVTAQTAAKRGAEAWALDKPYWEEGLANSADHPLWTGIFIRPVTGGRISTKFGSVRTVNQEDPTRHSGLDIALPSGTLVKASQAGVVTLARGLNVTGNTVFIDHGCQLFSMYYHLSHISVKVGQTVKAGDLIGKVGSTGFSTGPHLHWAMQLNGVYMNPDLFLNLVTAPMLVQDRL